MTAHAPPQAADADHLTAALRRADVLDDGPRDAGAGRSRLQTTRPIGPRATGFPPGIWWSNLERIHLAADDLDCRELLS